MTIFWIILAAIVAALVALFQYGYIFSNKKNNKRKPWFALLRFLTVFTILILFLDLKFDKTTYQTIKPLLLLELDNSSSIVQLKADEELKADYNSLINHPSIKENFEVQEFLFSDVIKPLDSLKFAGVETNIFNAIEQPQKLFKDRNKAIIILTDGNQTSGNSYSYASIDAKSAVFPVIYGDTTNYPDLKITQLNVNRYSYLNNEFPVEIFTTYTGSEAITTQFKITNGNTTLHQEQIRFSKDNPSQIVNLNLTSKKVGTQSLRASLTPLTLEKNISNNNRNFAVEVIDQQTKVLILSNVIHPDIAALKKAIASNQQRDVSIQNTDDNPDLNDYNMVIFYSPDNAFAKAYNQAKQLNKNTWTITGPSTDYEFLNSQMTAYSIEVDEEVDEVQPILNTSYTTFNLEDYSYDDYPPVQVPFGAVKMNTAPDVLIYKSIGDVETQQPLWFTYEENETRHAVFLAEGFWRWRAQSYLDEKDFKNWDELVGSQIQYLASNKRRNRLELDYKTFYYQNQKIIINAQYLDKNYEFEDNGILNITLIHKKSNNRTVRPFILDGNSYTVDLSGLEAGDYKFTVKVENDQLSQSGALSILEFDVEKQFISAHDQGMKQLVGIDGVYYQGQIDEVITQLLKNPLLKPVERSSTSYASLVDWQYLLGFILLLLGLEWFLRKYSGLV
ncbi:vWA domain-containing protein [Nonlabens sp. Asnod3-H03]|uniref:vWA domain-containing protein n=1 Tax=Nonlabens sp. Asnod3-H03 TaxID=3160580 RepID=UPI00386788C6